MVIILDTQGLAVCYCCIEAIRKMMLERILHQPSVDTINLRYDEIVDMGLDDYDTEADWDAERLIRNWFKLSLTE